MTDRFTGTGFDKSEFSPEERARFRELLKVLGGNFVELTPSQIKTIEAIDTMKRAWPLYLAMSASAVVLKQFGVL